MSKQLLISLSELKAKQRFTTWLGKHEILALITPQGARVYSGMCPHQGGPLGEGIFKDHQVTCPWHGCTFDLIQGACVDIGACRNLSGGMKLKALPFTVEAENLYVDLEEGSHG